MHICVFVLLGKPYLVDADHKFSTLREELIHIFPRVEAGALLVICLTAITKPYNSNFIYSVFPWHHPAARFIFVTIEVLIMVQVYILVNFVFLSGFYYTFSTNFWLKRLLELK
jgi:hypothetical protein